MSSISASAATYAAAAAQPQSPAKYVPVHRRAHASDDAAPHPRSPSPALSDTSTVTLVAPEAPSTKSRVYSITTLLQLAHEPEIKLVSLAQKDKLRDTAPEIVMNRKMRKALEYHAIQERMRVKALAQATEIPLKDAHDASSPNPHPISDVPIKFSPQQQRQRPGARRSVRSSAERRRNVSKAVDAASWRTFRLPSVAV
ncbi:hypothetical protein D9756_006806 [Leucocoprinus leucothites]|uniref:Uncharacterized protein n=1 Tax=Leucocoprinus leucothites TaxID=201217 RepID=A0A8H5G1Z7_9AGAR|nr:hypothetical protein D9756_006806 [Leucoagaricus leucothites]